MITHSSNPQPEAGSNLYTMLNQQTEMALPSFSAIEQPQLGQISRARSTSRKNVRRVTGAQLIKNNLLRQKQNRRADKLKEVTYDNIQMFLRIKAQTSHYQVKGLTRHKSCRYLSRKGQTKANETERKPSQTHESRQRPILRCHSAKTNLLNKCAQLKQQVSQRRPQKDNISSSQVQEVSNFPRVIPFTRRTICNKQNENENRGRPAESRLMTVNDAGKRAIAHKLGGIMPPKYRIEIDDEGVIRGTKKSSRLADAPEYNSNVLNRQRHSVAGLSVVNNCY